MTRWRPVFGWMARWLGALVLLASTAVPATAGEQRVTVTLVLFSDLYELTPNRAGRGGLAKLASVVKEERARNPNTLVIHAGDAISPSLMSSFDQGRHMIDLLSAIGLDVFVPGNHEFDFGTSVFRQRLAEATFPVVATNLVESDGTPVAGVVAQRLLDMAGVKIAVAGFITETTVTSSSPLGLAFTPVLKGALDAAARLRREGADIVVQVVHTPRSDDLELIAEEAGDVILSGHDHDLMIAYNDKVAFAEAMHDAYYVVALDLEIAVSEADGKRTVTWWPDFRVIDTAGVAPDPAIAARVATYEAALDANLAQPLTRLASPLDSRTPALRGGEAAMGNLFADALRFSFGADAALLNGGGIRGDRLMPAGTELTRGDIVAALPFNNTGVLLEITGRDLREALEEGFAQAQNLTGAFPQVSGLAIRADLSRPAGERVISVSIAGTALDDAGTYRLATNDYLARGGNGYDALRRARRLINAEEGRLLYEIVTDYLAKLSAVSAKVEGRIVVSRAAPPR